MSNSVVVLLRSEEGRKLVRSKCKAAGLDINILEQLINAEIDQLGKMRKRGLWEDFDEIFDDIDIEEES